MSLGNSSRRLAQSAVAFKSSIQQPQPCFLPSLTLPLTTSRTILERFFGRKKPQPTTILDPSNSEFLKRAAPTPRPTSKLGDLAPSSIFDSESPEDPDSDIVRRNPTSMAAALDPTPHHRKRWQRKMLIRDIRGRFRLTRTEKILRTERSSLLKSPLLKTSVKKLGPLARQIAGKPVEEAIVQMRFSAKKAAVDVRKHLERARDHAILSRGMGLGNLEEEDGKEGAEKWGGMVVEDKKGKRRFVSDKSSIYVDQAWVGRGTYGWEMEYRARGNVNMLRPPFTSISVVLKEEATRIRLADEREKKRQRKKVWVPLPDRPITAQRQYCLW